MSQVSPRRSLKIAAVATILWPAKLEGDHDVHVFRVLEDPVRATSKMTEVNDPPEAEKLTSMSF
jgi:hypothetical protein